MAKRRSAGKGLSETFLAELCNVVGRADAEARDRLIAQMEQAGIFRDEICDIYIPEAARRMGEDWSEDRMSFAEVSIRSARLQAMLRDLEKDDGDDVKRGDQSIMVISFETHTLGAMVLTARLRRSGASVCLMMGRTEAELEKAVSGTDFDGIFLSVSQADDLTVVSRIIETLRGVKLDKSPLIVGGGVVENGIDAALRLTGADHVTDDLMVALELCGCVIERADRK